jgi:hypothetical protein
VLCPWYDTPAWDVPIEAEARTQNIKDSCVVLYWAERAMKPNETREMAFTYGLNTLSAGEGTDRLALTVGGSFVVGHTFTATAYIKEPFKGQKVRLVLPPGLALAPGQADEQTIEAAEGDSQVSWRVRADKAGTHQVRAVSGTAGAAHQVVISNRSLFR